MTDHTKLAIAILCAELYAIQTKKTEERVLFDEGYYPADLKHWKKGKGEDRAFDFISAIETKLRPQFRDYVHEQIVHLK